MPRTHTALDHVHTPQAAVQPAAPSLSPPAQSAGERFDRTAQRRIVFWLSASLDAEQVATWRNTAAAFARDGYQLILAGLPSPSSDPDLPCLEGPPAPDDVPPAVLTDANPVATLARFGTTGSALLLADAGAHGVPAHVNHAFRRLRALSWIGEWMTQWLDAIDPDVVVLLPASRDGVMVLLESMARQRRIRVATGDDVIEVARTAPRRPPQGPRRAVAEVCRTMNAWMARGLRAGEAQHP